ncbi:MAG: DUF86 domain-containing protein [Candidatus Delongbacteria bacterium]|nr:DUF86 domain-containing protein [Candidatus Delongbacteria bacterium]
MYDKELVHDILKQILEAIEKINNRFTSISKVSDFTDTPEGIDKLDAICMMLIAIGESLKNVDKITDKMLFPKYPKIDWRGVKGLRDIISHHYFDIDAEEIFWVCEYQIQPLGLVIEKMIKEQE